jgi:hypothetical protein
MVVAIPLWLEAEFLAQARDFPEEAVDVTLLAE